MKSERSAPSVRPPSLWYLGAIVVLVCLLLAIAGYVTRLAFRNWTEAASFGETFGAVSALFSGLAFAGVVFALFLQRADLALQREASARQAFENAFFELLRLQRDCMTSIRARPAGAALFEATRAFREAADELRRKLDMTFNPPLEGDSKRDMVGDTHKRVCLAPESDFGHYFRSLYHLVRYVHDSRRADASRYVMLVRAQLSTDELTLLFTNGLSEAGRGFKPLMEKYAVFHNWRLPKWVERYTDLYEPAAFGHNDEKDREG